MFEGAVSPSLVEQTSTRLLEIICSDEIGGMNDLKVSGFDDSQVLKIDFYVYYFLNYSDSDLSH